MIRSPKSNPKKLPSRPKSRNKLLKVNSKPSPRKLPKRRQSKQLPRNRRQRRRSLRKKRKGHPRSEYAPESYFSLEYFLNIQSYSLIKTQ